MAQKRGIVPRAFALSLKHRQDILKHVASNDKDTFLKSLNRWSQYSLKDLQEVLDKVKLLINKMLSRNEKLNLNGLFEATSHLSILRAVLDGKDDWNIVDVEVQKTKNSHKIAYLLQREDVFFKLGKGKPPEFV